MEFFNRIGDFAKNVGDRTNDMLEIGKLNSRIHGEEDAIEQHFYDLGEYIWEKFESGVAMDERATVICMAIRERKGNIRSMEEEIQQIRLAQEENRQARAQAGRRQKSRPGRQNPPRQPKLAPSAARPSRQAPNSVAIAAIRSVNCPGCVIRMEKSGVAPLFFVLSLFLCCLHSLLPFFHQANKFFCQLLKCWFSWLLCAPRWYIINVDKPSI